jgi:hypothetical protein
MDKSKISTVFKTVKTVVRHHSPEILTGIGIAGMLTTTVLAVKATPKALKDIEEYKEAVLRDHEKIKPIDAVKVAWKHYIPAAVTGTLSVACLVGASSVNVRRNAALATAYKLSEKAFTEYREAVTETVGEKKECEVRDTMAKRQVEKNPISKNTIIYTGKGDSLFYDATCGRYFKSNIDKINKVVLELNKRMRDEMEITLNEFYYEISTELESVDIGDYLTWSIDDEYIDVHFSAILVNDEPCTVMSFNTPPKHRN